MPGFTLPCERPVGSSFWLLFFDSQKYLKSFCVVLMKTKFELQKHCVAYIMQILYPI